MPSEKPKSNNSVEAEDGPGVEHGSTATENAVFFYTEHKMVTYRPFNAKTTSKHEGTDKVIRTQGLLCRSTNPET